jgi:molecular chaperone GrpE (heat shock protein)
MPRARAVLALILALSLAAARPAAGGCCDDFWSCAGTVATGGLSCAVETALEAVRALIASVRSERDATSSQMLAGLKATEDEMRAELERLDREIKTAVQEIDRDRDEGDKILKEDADTIRTKLAEAKLHANAATAGGVKASSGPGPASKAAIRPGFATATPVPAAPSGLAAARISATADVNALTELQSDDSLATLRHRLEELKKHKEALLKAIVQKEAEMTGKEMAAALQARTSLQNDFLKPIDDLLAALDAALRNPLNAPSVVAAAVRLLDGALDGFRSIVQPRADAVADAADRAVGAKTPSTGAIKKIADEAKRTLAAMRKVASYRAILDRRAAVRDVGVLPAATPSTISTAVRLRSSAAFGEIARKVPPRLGALKQQVQKLSQLKRNVDVSSFRPKLAGDFNGYFRGKSPSDAKKKLADLTAEARRRFASDPKTLAAVEKLLNDEARARGVPL